MLLDEGHTGLLISVGSGPNVAVLEAALDVGEVDALEEIGAEDDEELDAGVLPE